MKIGVIGGSGLYDVDMLTKVRERRVKTSFGKPSDAYIAGKYDGHEIFFLPRHGRGHMLLPSEINHRANIMGFKMLGVTHVLSISAVGSLKKTLRPRDIVLPDQYFDRTKKSLEHTFFGGGVVAHVTFGHPTCPAMKQALSASIRTHLRSTRNNKVRLHVGGTYVNMEGPAFSTRAESRYYCGQGFDVIGMTSLPEAKLCREAEICYQPIAMVTDYDSWHEENVVVSCDMVISHLRANTKIAKELLPGLIQALARASGCGCADALKYALMTDLKKASPATRRKLQPIIGKYLPR